MKFLRKLKYLLIFLVLLILLHDSGKRQDLAFSCEEKKSENWTKMLLGGFRGLVADVVFLKCVNLQDEKRYDDIPALAEWVVGLQPEYTESGRFWASNLAWNISIEHGDYALRWKWVQHGIRLLKDVAIPGSDDPEYYLEMAMIYRMRIGEIIEPADAYFKTMLATDMQKVMGDWSMEALAQTPDSVYGLNEFLGDNRFEEILSNSDISEKMLFHTFKQTGKLSGLDVSEFEAEKIELFFRRRFLVESFGIDPSVASEVEGKYGKLDWRIADSLAVYWAYSGKNRAVKLGRPLYRFDRMISRALLRIFRNGNLLYVDDKSVIHTSPNFEVATALDKIYPDLIKNYKLSEKMSRESYERFLLQATSLFFVYGQEAEANRFFRKYQQNYQDASKGKNLHAVALEGLSGMGKSHDYRAVQSLISGVYLRMFEFMGQGDMNKAFALDKTAQKIWKNYKVNPDVAFYEKDKLPPLKEIKLLVYQNATRNLPSHLSKTIIQSVKKLKASSQ